MPYFALIIMFYHVKIACYQNLSQKYFQMIVMRLRRDIKDQSKLDLMI